MQSRNTHHGVSAYSIDGVWELKGEGCGSERGCGEDPCFPPLLSIHLRIHLRIPRLL